MRPTSTLALLATGLVAGAIGCTGVLGEDDHGPPLFDTTSLACTVPDPGPAPIRRLTRFEYDNTVADLLGDTTAPARNFPAEEEAYGFTNNANVLGVTPVLAEQYMVTAEKLATLAATRLDTLVPCDVAKSGEASCAKTFITRFGRRAFRRPLTDEETADFLTIHADGRKQGGTYASGLKFVIETMLQSPSFLYRIEQGRIEGRSDSTQESSASTVVDLTSFEIASRLSYLLWGSMPDEVLLDAAASSALGTEEQVVAQAQRMLKDPRAHRMVAHFHGEWLGLARIDSTVKATTMFPEFDGLKGDMRRETEMFLDDVFWNDGRLDSLLTAPQTFVSEPLAKLYGLPSPGLAPGVFKRVDLDPAQRGGFLTQPAFLSIQAKANQTSPIHRGKFVRERLLCDMLPPPPNDIVIVPPEVTPGSSSRERFAQHSKDARCVGCHKLMDPIGFAFEHYDAIGKWRTTDGLRPVDARGTIVDTADVDGDVDGAVALGSKLAASEQVRACVVRQWFRYGYGRAETPRDACAIRSLQRSFAASGFDLRALLVSMTTTPTFRVRDAVVATKEPWK